MLPSQEETITRVIVDASNITAGLLALALTLSAIVGLSLGVRMPGQGKRWCRESSM